MTHSYLLWSGILVLFVLMLTVIAAYFAERRGALTHKQTSPVKMRQVTSNAAPVELEKTGAIDFVAARKKHESIRAERDIVQSTVREVREMLFSPDNRSSLNLKNFWEENADGS